MRDQIILTNCQALSASFILGLNKTYTSETWKVQDVCSALSKYQKQVKAMLGITLSTEVGECTIICEDQAEKSVRLSFIQHPKYLVSEQIFRETVLECAKEMLLVLRQNRTIICFDNDHVMLEVNSQTIDPGIG